jgi:hypothetical protein
MSLPKLYDGWIREALGRELPMEGRATCLSCPMIEASGRPRGAAFFHPNSKCCTYLPVLCNFHVGQILRDDTPEMAVGRTSVEARIAAHVAVTPLGLGWPAVYERMYDDDREYHFGRRLEMRCPHYIDRDGGLCGVWRYRNAICSTWFCRHERGHVGRSVWEHVEGVLEVVEEGLTRWCMEQAGVEPELVERLSTSDDSEDCLDGDVTITDALRARAWGRWYGRELAYFKHCAELVERDVTWKFVRGLCGARLAAKLEELQDALGDHDNTRLPPFVAAGGIERVVFDDEGMWVHSYRPYDIEPISEDLWELLDELQPMPTEALLELLVEQHDIWEPRAAVRSWLDQGNLEPTLPD